jgi:hypothetical protein
MFANPMRGPLPCHPPIAATFMAASWSTIIATNCDVEQGLARVFVASFFAMPAHLLPMPP